MRCVLLAEPAILVYFHPLRVELLLLCKEIVTTLALCTCKNDFGALCSHGYSPPKSFIYIVPVYGNQKSVQEKKDLVLLMLSKHTISICSRQAKKRIIFFIFRAFLLFPMHLQALLSPAFFPKGYIRFKKTMINLLLIRFKPFI